ncbi:predicted protein [Naegleria gruberi]|uniref:Predicted protein n=1 Tax=Naegleria gruberi TaxID=5762 RepID=D2VJ55_NAEGR|nr:uncharacterized protein NAEGRDRAFT_76557 [Naegleria gruberi]XP_002675881.1 uncharacterized protein NAEGRDRAFT_68913 [Naegleria gruberi]EFC35780.1 predicted protein [Naegleria gruberi]EFC43137.1 predicted protein [Naegleria gruberi]|eukprot:XP_002668524.1 predicted protein [Naegleria gruberi strain NEG-M]
MINLECEVAPLLRKFMYLANIMVAGYVACFALFFPQQAQSELFYGNSLTDDGSTIAVMIVGCHWMAIVIISMLGLFFPLQCSIVFVHQLIYKSLYLLLVALPAMWMKREVPQPMTTLFAIWVLLLPLVIPWHYLFHSEDNISAKPVSTKQE